MFYFVLSVHLLLCAVLIGLVLLQQGKGASAGAIFGGSSNTLFGASGANTVLTKITTGTAIAFMVTSIILVKSYSSHVRAGTGTTDPLSGSVMQDTPVTQLEVQPAESAPPAAPPLQAPAADAPAPAAKLPDAPAAQAPQPESK